MRKIVVVAKSEFLTAVKSKGFIIGVLLMPILVGISIAVQAFSERHADTSDRRFAVIDDTGVLYDVLSEAARARNQKLDAAGEAAKQESRFIPSRFMRDSRSPDDARVELSEKIRRGELFAFVEIPSDAVPPAGATPSGEVTPDPVASSRGAGAKITYYSDKPTYEDLRTWVASVVNQVALRHRLWKLSDAEFRDISKVVESEHRGLASRGASGEFRGAAEVNKALTEGIPIILMFLLWMVVMSAAPQLLNSAIEEKMIRVSEVILGSVTPFELMMGKLFASAGVSSVLASLYLTGGIILANHMGHGDWVPYSLLPYFALFMLLAVLFFGSVFIAIGAACSELKDAQGLMTPAMVILMLPIFVWAPVLKHPDGTFAVAASLFPPATPMLMLLRLSTHPSPPAWQVILSIALTTLTTVGGVWAAGRIFRIGILSQGKTPSFRDLIRWIRTP